MKKLMDRPRKAAAKFANANIAPDVFAQPDLSVDYVGKGDRWTGYNPSQYRAVIEKARRQIRAGKLNAEETDERYLYKDEDKYVVEVDMLGIKVDSKPRISVRNLRITEDTAKYLRKATAG